MQVFSGGENVARTATPSALDNLVQGRWSLAFINDGFTSQGELLDWPEWLRGLSRRREVIQEIARLDAAREPLVSAALWRLGLWTLTALGAIALVTVWWSVRQRRARRRELARLRQRIAGDLHDEIGSNLGTIALLARLASGHENNGAHADLAEIQRIARETTDSMRDIVWLINPGERNAKDLLARMREVATQQLPDAECRFEAEGVTGPFSLEFERQVFLFFKEALNNIRKHSRARHIAIRVMQDARDFSLLIADDGAGFDPDAPASGHGLTSMRHRAGLLGGSLTLQSRPAQGTHLELRARLP
jgi:signal transduction histidine kinase